MATTSSRTGSNRYTPLRKKPVPPVTPSVTAEDRKRAKARAVEWKTFRRDYLFSQRALADHLDCARRTVVSIENGSEVFNPHPDLLRKFRDLRRDQELARKRYEMAVT